MKQLTILVGPPGSGKSTLCQSIPSFTDSSSKNGFARVSQDFHGKAGHWNVFNSLLKEDINIIIDRMNFNKEQRARYLIPAKAAGYKTNIIVLHESLETCLARCKARQNHETIKDEKTARKVLEFFFKNYERPTEDEADEIEFRYPEGDKPEALICDLDGTLCNVDHRLHFVKKRISPDAEFGFKPPKPDWGSFFKEMVNDTVNQWCKDILTEFFFADNEDLKTGKKIILCSGRPDSYHEITKIWLEKNGILYHDLFMRGRNDFRRDDITKEVILDFEILTRYKPSLFIDDRQQVIDLWRRRGFVALQCAKGDF